MRSPILAIALLAATCACTTREVESNARLLSYTLVNEETSIDPQTGDLITIGHWRYEDGYTTTTRRVTPRGGEATRTTVRVSPPDPPSRATD